MLYSISHTNALVCCITEFLAQVYCVCCVCCVRCVCVCCVCVLCVCVCVCVCVLCVQVAIKPVARVDLEQLERVLRGEQMGMPFESIQALDVVLRHLPSMR